MWLARILTYAACSNIVTRLHMVSQVLIHLMLYQWPLHADCRSLGNGGVNRDTHPKRMNQSTIGQRVSLTSHTPTSHITLTPNPRWYSENRRILACIKESDPLILNQTNLLNGLNSMLVKHSASLSAPRFATPATCDCYAFFFAVFFYYLTGTILCSLFPSNTRLW